MSVIIRTYDATITSRLCPARRPFVWPRRKYITMLVVQQCRQCIRRIVFFFQTRLPTAQRYIFDPMINDDVRLRPPKAPRFQIIELVYALIIVRFFLNFLLLKCGYMPHCRVSWILRIQTGWRIKNVINIESKEKYNTRTGIRKSQLKPPHHTRLGFLRRIRIEFHACKLILYCIYFVIFFFFFTVFYYVYSFALTVVVNRTGLLE